MKSVIVVISGSSGTGKDTLIERIVDRIKLLCEGQPYPPMRVVSSIDPVKLFYNQMRIDAGLEPVTTYGDTDRIALAAIKDGLDRGFGFTSGLGDALVTNGEPGSILLYQVREVQSIAALMDLAQMDGAGYSVLWVHVQRKGFDGLNKAPSDRYAPQEIASADVLVQNTSLEDLDDWADLIARRVNKLRSS